MKTGLVTTEFWVVIATFLTAIFGGDQNEWVNAIQAIVAGAAGVAYIVYRIQLKIAANKKK